MNTRERFVRVLTGGDADRVPFIKLFGGTNAAIPSWLREYPQLDTYIDDLLGFEGVYRGWSVAPVNVWLFGDIGPDTVEYESATERRVRHGDGSLTVHMNRDGHYFNHRAEHAVKCADDWENIKSKGWLDPDNPQRFAKSWRHHTEIFAKRDYPLQLTCGGVYGFTRNLMGDENLCIAMYEEPELVHDMIGTYIDMCIAIWKKMVVDVQFDIIECWEDMAYKSGSMISKKLFDEFMAPHYRRIRAFADNNNIPIVLVDSDGNINELAEWMLEAGVNAMYPFEVQSGHDIPSIRKKLPGMGCIGGLDKECMARGKKAIDDEIEKARALIPLGKFISGPDHFVLENVKFESYEYFMKELKKAVLETKF